MYVETRDIPCVPSHVTVDIFVITVIIVQYENNIMIKSEWVRWGDRVNEMREMTRDIKFLQSVQFLCSFKMYSTQIFMKNIEYVVWSM